HQPLGSHRPDLDHHPRSDRRTAGRGQAWDVTRSATVSRRFDPLIIGALAVAVLGVSTSGPLIAYATAPALAIAFWRTALALGVLGPVAATRRRHEVTTLLGR